MQLLTYIRTRPHAFVRRSGALLLNLLLPGTSRREINDSPQSLLVISPEKAGDALLTTPLIQSIKQHLPYTRVYVWAWSANADIYIHDPHITEVFVCPGGYRAVQLLRTLRSYRFDMLYNPKDHPSITFLVLTLLVRAPCKVALHHRLQDRFYHGVLPSPLHTHALERHCALLDALHIPWCPEDLRPAVYIPAESRERIHRSLEELGSRGTPEVLFNLSAGRPQREWSLPSWVKLGQRIGEEFRGSRIILLSLPKDQGKAQAVQRGIGERARCAPALPTLLDAAALIDCMDMIVSPDTSIIHICSALQVPVVGLYTGNERNRRMFSPWRVPHRIVWSEHEEVLPIDSEEVYTALQALWSDVRHQPHSEWIYTSKPVPVEGYRAR